MGEGEGEGAGEFTSLAGIAIGERKEVAIVVNDALNLDARICSWVLVESILS